MIGNSVGMNKHKQTTYKEYVVSYVLWEESRVTSQWNEVRSFGEKFKFRFNFAAAAFHPLRVTCQLQFDVFNKKTR